MELGIGNSEFVTLKVYTLLGQENNSYNTFEQSNVKISPINYGGIFLNAEHSKRYLLDSVGLNHIGLFRIVIIFLSFHIK